MRFTSDTAERLVKSGEDTDKSGTNLRSALFEAAVQMKSFLQKIMPSKKDGRVTKKDALAGAEQFYKEHEKISHPRGKPHKDRKQKV